MVKRSVLNNWDNGNFCELDRNDLIILARYFEARIDGDFEDIEEDMEED
jgi:hypothetical protein